MKHIYLFAFLFLSSNASAEYADWNGIWGTVTQTKDDFKVSEVRIQNCSAEKKECDLMLDLPPDWRQELTLKVSSLTEATAELKGVDGEADETENCKLKLNRNGSFPAELKVHFLIKPGCSWFKKEKKSSRKSKQTLPPLALNNFSRGLYEECGLAKGKVRDAWCLNPKVNKAREKEQKQQEDTSWETRYDIKQVWNGKAWDFIDPRELCAEKVDVVACMVQFYEAEIEKLKNASQKEWREKLPELERVYRAADLQKAKMAIAEIAGVYKKRFQNGNIDGDKYESEDILELVPLPGDGLYVRASLKFSNGHGCSYHGAFRYNEAGEFVDMIRLGVDEGSRFCRILIKPSSETIEIDSPDCTSHHWCGARGVLKDKFKLSSRRSIRYMTLLKNSVEYKESLTAWEKSKGIIMPVKAPH